MSRASDDPYDGDPALDALRRVLHEEADVVRIGGDGLGRILQRTRRPAPRWRRGAVPALAAAAVAAVVGGGLLVGTLGDGSRPPVAGPTMVPTPAPSGPASPSRTASPTVSATPGGDAGSTVQRAVPVYYVVDTRLGLRLAREFHRVTTDDPTAAAVRQLDLGPADPDHRSLLQSTGLRVVSVARERGRLVVDVTGAVEGPLTAGREGPEGVLVEQQLVWTVTAAAQANLPVEVRERRGAVRFEALYTRSPELDVLATVQLDDPVENARVARTFTVKGRAAVFEATLDWRLLRGSRVVADGSAMTAEGQRFAPYEFRVSAPAPGTYRLEVAESDPSGGEGGQPFAETRSVRVG
jgi:hypothetical protein